MHLISHEPWEPQALDRLQCTVSSLTKSLMVSQTCSWMLETLWNQMTLILYVRSYSSGRLRALSQAIESLVQLTSVYWVPAGLQVGDGQWRGGDKQIWPWTCPLGAYWPVGNAEIRSTIIKNEVNLYQDAQGSKEEVEGARGTLCGVQWGAFQKGLSEGEMHEQKCAREGARWWSGGIQGQGNGLCKDWGAGRGTIYEGPEQDLHGLDKESWQMRPGEINSHSRTEIQGSWLLCGI